MEQIKRKRRELGELMFALQLMNDCNVQGEKPWQPNCEHFCTIKDVVPDAFKVVLSDPAPAKVGSYIEEKKTDGDKNEWATVTVAFQTRGQRREIILLDGAASKEWPPSEGWREVCRQKRRWKTGECAVEKTGQAVAFYMEELSRVSRQEKVRHHEHELTMTYRGKNNYFAGLCDRAKQGEFLICDTVPKEFVDGFIDQCRNWLPLPNGKNTLRLDDRANVVSFATDPCFRKYTPEVAVQEWSPYTKGPDDPPRGGTLHVGW